MSLNRRTFVKTSALVASAASSQAFTAKSYARIGSHQDNIRCAVIGLNGRGRDHMRGLGEHVVALCDCDSKVLESRAKDKDVATFADYRTLLEDKSIDAVSIATPNHTHSIIAIAAIMAGKDVYCEKPISHNVWEGRQLANAAEKYDRIVQCGTQSRSSPSLQEAVKFVRGGQLGKILYATGTCYKPRKSIGKLEKPLQIPKNINYDLWCGPADKKALFRPKIHYDWHWDFNTGNGDMGNQGIHQMDIARWFLGQNQLSPRVLSIGGRLGYDDAGDTPNTQTVIHDYPEAPLIFETRGLPRAKAFQSKGWGQNMDNYRGSRIGVIIQCEKGYVVIPSYTAAKAFDSEDNEIKSWNGGADHYKNFLDAVRAKDKTMLNAPIVEGHLSSALCHTGGLSHQLGENVSAAEIKDRLSQESDWFRDSFERMAQHLAANGIDINQGKSIVLGANLKMDTDAERFTNSEKANALVARKGRPGFIVPEVSLAKVS